MRSKAMVSERLPIRRGLSEPEAALYVGVGATKFRELVKKGEMPRQSAEWLMSPSSVVPNAPDCGH